jgi:hypothetical protein
MTNVITDKSQRKASIVFGVAIVAMFILAIIVDNFILSNFIGPGDVAALATDIEADQTRFGFAVAGYLLILLLDLTIALAVYVILKPVSKILAALTAGFRLLYTAIMVIGVLALAFEFINVQNYGNMKLFGYIFFTAHIFMLGYSVLKSGYIQKWLGILLIVAFFCYIVLLYGKSMVPEQILPIFVVPAAIAELFLGIWLLWKGGKVPTTAMPGGGAAA